MPELGDFLTNELPALLASVKYDFEQPLITVQLVVPGHTELRTFYELTANGVTVKPGLAETAPNVTLSMQVPELEALRSRSLDIQEAMILGRVQLFGDPSIAQRLGRLLSGSSVWGAPAR